MADVSNSRISTNINAKRIERELGPRPEMRINDNEAKKLKRIAILAEIIDSTVGLFPAAGDVAAWLFNWALVGFFYKRYGISFSTFIQKGSGGTTGTFLTTLGELLVGIIPVIGDFLDIFYASWYYKVSSSINKIQEEDREKIKTYEQKKQRLVQQVVAIRNTQQQNTDQEANQSDRTPSNRYSIDREARRKELTTTQPQSPYPAEQQSSGKNAINGIREQSG